MAELGTNNLIPGPGPLVRPATLEEIVQLAFPENGYIGVAAEFADAYSQRYESPKEFFYIDCLVLIGAIISGRVRADFDVPCQPRLYTLKVAPSAWRRKSTSTSFADQFIRSTLKILPPDASATSIAPDIAYGVGSAEGLAEWLKSIITTQAAGAPQVRHATKRLVLVFDELRRFEAKATIKNSSLLSMVNELYEKNQYTNRTKDTFPQVADGHLVFVSNSTEETFRNLFNASEFRDIGFLNRLFFGTGNSSKRISKPVAPPEEVLAPIRKRLADYIAALPPLNQDGSASREVVIRLTPGAFEIWDKWYQDLEECEETARLDNMGMRLMGLLAFCSGKSEIDEDLLHCVLDILEYQRRVRSVLRPIEGENPEARMEQKIRTALLKHGPLTDRDLRRYTNADRFGLTTYKKARTNLQGYGEIAYSDKKWMLKET